MIGLLDTGAWVGYLLKDDQYHGWAKQAMSRYTGFLTCEAVLSEVSFLLRGTSVPSHTPVAMLGSGAIRLGFALGEEHERVLAIMQRYPQASLADACLVRLSELHPGADVVTTDETDFSVYRRIKRGIVPFYGPTLGHIR